MTDLDALLAGIVSDPHEHLRWLIVADWLDDHGFAERAELLRLHRMLIDTCCEPDQHPEREGIHTRIMELMRSGVEPCVPQHTLLLRGGVELVGNFIPPGAFLMGSEVEENEQPVHKVTLTRGFFMGIHPVTQTQWVAVRRGNPSEFQGADLPVESVSWEDAHAFCGKASALAGHVVRLPTEAEWEYACRSGTDTPFYWGGSLNGTRANCNGNYPYGTAEPGPYREATSSVGLYAGVSPHPWGLADLHGNVWEWCRDVYDTGHYSRSPASDPECRDGKQACRVMRGGSWYINSKRVRAASRAASEPVSRSSHTGFRVAFTLD